MPVGCGNTGNNVHLMRQLMVIISSYALHYITTEQIAAKVAREIQLNGTLLSHMRAEMDRQQEQDEMLKKTIIGEKNNCDQMT